MSDHVDSKIKEYLLNEMLGQELSKPSEIIDIDLVTKILDALNIPEPTPEQMEASWKVVKDHLEKVIN